MSRLALVTGAGRGIGRAIALRLAQDGCRIALHYRSSAAGAEETAQQIRTSGGEAEIFGADLTASSQVAEMFGLIKSRMGSPEILVNNAGATKDGLVMRMRDEDWKTVLDADLTSVFYCTREALKGMTKARWGRVVTITSVVGLAGNAGQANYAAAKAGAIGLTRSAAREYGGRNVTFNCVAPGFIETDMTAGLSQELKDQMLASTPLGRAGQPEDVASAVAFLVSDAAAFITGQVLAVNGGMTMQ